MKWEWVHVQVKQGEWVANVIESRIQILIVKYLLILFSKLIALMKFSVLEVAGFALWVNFTCFLMTFCLNSLLFKTMGMGETF